MKLTASNIVCELSVPGMDVPLLDVFVSQARHAARVRGRVSVLITCDGKMLQLNRRFRRKRSATDVLSFPATDSDGFAGDIAVSIDFAMRNAKALGHSISDEIRVLILHGLLHLAGYDHDTDGGEMALKEAALRRHFELPESLIERSSRGKGLVRRKPPSVIGRRSKAKVIPSTSPVRRELNSTRNLNT
jgi:probable rRNA maturation factor